MSFWFSPGPTGDKPGDHLAESAYPLFRWNPRTEATRELFMLPAMTHSDGDGDVKPDKPDKPEAILPLGIEDGRIEVLVLSYGPKDGAPKSYRFAW